MLAAPPPDRSNAQHDSSRPLQAAFGRNPTSSKLGRSGPPPRIDPSAASKQERNVVYSLCVLTRIPDRPFLRPDQRTSASNGHDSPKAGSSGPRSPFRMPPRSRTTPLPLAPPSPEFTNLDCAFPPFPTTANRSATPIKDSASTISAVSDLDYEYVREHAEPYNMMGPRSPRSIFDANHTRGLSVGSSRSRNRSMTAGAHAEPIPRPSTAGGVQRRKPSLASISGGPKSGIDAVPPMPPSQPQNNQSHTASTSANTALSSSPHTSPPRRQRADGDHSGLGSALEGGSTSNINPYNRAQPFLANEPPILRSGRSPSPWINDQPQSAMHPPNLRNQTRPSRMDDSFGRASIKDRDHSQPRAPSSPSRSQTFPIRKESRDLNGLPTGGLPRRPSEPSPASRHRRPAMSNRNESAPEQPHNFMPYQPGEPNLPLQGSRNFAAPQRGATPPQTGPTSLWGGFPARLNGGFAPPKEGFFPPRATSRNVARSEQVLPKNHNRMGEREANVFAGNPAQLPVASMAAELDIGNPYHTPTDSNSSDASSISVAQTGSSMSSPPRSVTSEAPSKIGHKPDSLDLKLELDIQPPQRPDSYSRGPDSPTDPAFQHGRLSPIPGHESLEPLPLAPAPLQTTKSRQKQDTAPTPARRPTTGAGKGPCRECNLPIIGKAVSSADGRLTGRYHKECFNCRTCHQPFATADFYVHQNHPYCAQHYHALNNSLCKACNSGIEGQYLETDTSRNDKDKYHPGCFTCTTCRIPLQNDYFELSAKVYCERDAHRAMQLHSKGNNLLGVPGSRGQRPGGPQRFPERRTTKLMMMA